MICITKSVDSLVKKAINKSNQATISRIDGMMQQLQLDPTLSQPVREMYIFSSDDIRNPKVRSQMEEALIQKHKLSKVIFIHKGGRDVELPNVDIILVKPKHNEVADAISRIASDIQNKPEVIEDQFKEIEEFKPKVVEEAKEIDVKDKYPERELVTVADVTAEELCAAEDFNTPIKEESDNDLEIIKRIKNVESIVDLSPIAMELKASEILKEINAKNAMYKSTEVMLNALSEKINMIMCDPSLSLDEKLVKVRAAMFDKNVSKGTIHSIIHQNVEEIVTLLVDKTKESFGARLQEIDFQVMRAGVGLTAEAKNARLSAIMEERVNTLVELATLENEAKQLAKATDSLVSETALKISSDSTELTNIPLVDDKLRLKYGNLAPESSLLLIERLCQLGADSTDEFRAITTLIAEINRKVYKLLSLQKEENQVLADTISYLKANKVEDTVIANTLLKKTGRLFVGTDCSGRSVTAYMTSREQARKFNTLLVDLSGSSAYDEYGIPTLDYDEFITSPVYKHFAVLKANVEDSPSTAQRLLTAITHLAKHYSIINVVLSDKQVNMIQHLTTEFLTVNFVVSCEPRIIRDMSKVIELCRPISDNTATRVILNNYVGDSSTIARALGVIERLDVNMIKVEVCNELKLCCLKAQDPYDVDSIRDAFKEVLEVC